MTMVFWLIPRVLVVILLRPKLAGQSDGLRVASDHWPGRRRHYTMATIEQTHQWLQATLNPDLAQRQAAEEALKQAEPTPQHAVQLFRLAADSSVQVDDAMRQAAAHGLLRRRRR